MTSDEFFWRLVLATRTMDEAVLLWWLALVGADERPYVPPRTSLDQIFGLNRLRALKAASGLKRCGLVSIKVLKSRFTQFTLSEDGLRVALALGQKETVCIDRRPFTFDPAATASYCGLPSATAFSRLCLKRWNRGEAIVLAWLLQAGWSGESFTLSSRSMHSSMLGLVDRRTMLRALERFAIGGLLDMTDAGRAGQTYRLNLGACRDLLVQPPMIFQVTNTLPGWSTLTCPLMAKLTKETTNADESFVSGAASSDGLSVDLVPVNNRGLDEVVG